MILTVMIRSTIQPGVPLILSVTTHTRVTIAGMIGIIIPHTIILIRHIIIHITTGINTEILMVIN